MANVANVAIVKVEPDPSADLTLRGRKRRRPRYWDMTPQVAIQHGLPLERAQATVPSKTGVGALGGGNNNACKIYCGFRNLIARPSEQELMDFFNITMVAAQGSDRKPGNSVVGVFISPENSYAFIHFRSEAEACQALDLDGIIFRGERLRLGPSHQQGVAQPITVPDGVRPLNIQHLGIISTQVPDGPNKIYIGGIPPALTYDQVKELLSTYGNLRGLFLSRDDQTGCNKGFAFAEYRDRNVTQNAIKGLNGLQVGDKRLTLKIHDSGLPNHTPTTVIADLGLGLKSDVSPSEVVCFLQMVTENDLLDTQEYNEIFEDIREESGKFGPVLDVVIPRPVAGQRVAGVGKVFVRMDTIENATKVKLALEGRQFMGRTVLATFFDLEQFNQRRL